MWKEIGLVSLGILGGVGVSVLMSFIEQSLHEVRNGLSHLRDSISSLSSSHNVLCNEVRTQMLQLSTKLETMAAASKVQAQKESEAVAESEEVTGTDRSI